MLTTPAILKVFSVFTLVLILNRLRLQLGLSLFVGSLILGLWMGLGPLPWARIALVAMSQFQTVNLVLVVMLILIMSRIMKESGHMDRLVASFAGLSRDGRTTGSVLTALIGLLPMPGGALFSAPMVETSLNGHGATREQKTLLNYWFRHIWEYWWPLYPGVVLAVALLEVETWRYILFMAPMTLISVLAGIFFILRPIGGAGEGTGGGVSWDRAGAFLWEVMPILIVILVIIVLAGGAGILRISGIDVRLPGSLSILIGLVVSIFWVCRINRIPFDRFRSAVMSREMLSFLFLLLAIMVFKGTMIESRAVAQIRQELMAYRIPVFMVVMIMPFLSGMITGVAVGFVGTSFPLIIPMFPSGSIFDYLSYAALAYSFGYMGMMLSPVHLCFLVTKDYYGASLLKSYATLIKPSLTVMAAAGVLFLASRLL